MAKGRLRRLTEIKRRGKRTMPLNKLIVEKDSGLEVKVYDGEGVEHDITAAFRSISGSTSPAAVTNTVKLQEADTDISIDFQATSKNMEFGLDPSVVKQLVALAE